MLLKTQLERFNLFNGQYLVYKIIDIPTSKFEYNIYLITFDQIYVTI